MCRLITWNVNIWNHDLVEAHYTRVRDNNEHCTSTKQLLVKYYFILYLWQGVAVGLNVECLKIMNCMVAMHNRSIK